MVISTFEDFILTVYVVIDDLHRQFAPHEVMQRRHVFSVPGSPDFVIDSFPLAFCQFGIEITPASMNDREGLRNLVEYQTGLVILGDKGYVGESLAAEMARQENCLMALKHSNSKTDWPKPVRQLIFKLRRCIETVFLQLSEQLNAERVRAKSFQGLCPRLTNKILEYNLCLVLNNIF